MPTLLLTILVACAQQGTTRISAIGEFSNMRYSGEHAYGYTVQLWSDHKTLVGFFLSSAGLAGDTPTGILENVQFDSRTGKLSFKARLTMGSAFIGNGKQEPSRDLFEFEGKLSPGALAGILKHSDLLHTAAAVTPVPVRLAKQKQITMLEARTFEEWKSQAAEMLKLRGPKW